MLRTFQIKRNTKEPTKQNQNLSDNDFNAYRVN